MTKTVLIAAQALLATLANPEKPADIEEAHAAAITALEADGPLHTRQKTALECAVVDTVVAAKQIPLAQLHYFLQVRAQLDTQVFAAASSIDEVAIELCALAGVRLEHAAEPEVAGMWDWHHAGESCDYSHDTKADAARHALETLFGDAWRYAVANGDTTRGYWDWIREEGIDMGAVEN